MSGLYNIGVLSGNIGRQPSSAQVIDLAQLFQKQFGSTPYVINKDGELSSNPGDAYIIREGRTRSLNAGPDDAGNQFTAKGSLLKETVSGVNILLPVKLFDGSQLLMHLPYVVVSIRSRKTIVETPMWERKGTVKEQYSIEDYNMVVKGFLINETKTFPEELYQQLKDIYEQKLSVTVDNALFNIFLTDEGLATNEQRRVVIYDLDFPEVTGGKHAKPFVMNLKSDSVFTLELES